VFVDFFQFKVIFARWLTPVILSIKEAEIRMIAVQNHPRQIVHIPYLENT
jgi:hypothetical protein